MLSIDLIRDNLKRSEELVLRRVEDMRDHAFVAPSPRGGCHTLWVLGHLAFIEGLVVRHFMLGDPNPHAAWEEAFDGDEVSGAPESFPPFDQVLASCRATRAATIALLDTLEETDLDRTSAACLGGVAALFGTYRKCLQYTSDHWFMHRGHLADARRAAGVERMWY